MSKRCLSVLRFIVFLILVGNIFYCYPQKVKLSHKERLELDSIARAPLAWPGVPWGTRNPVGRSGDHPARLNTDQ